MMSGIGVLQSFVLRSSFRRFGVWFGKFLTSEGFEFAADDISGETGGEERTINRSEFFVRDLTPEGTKFAFDALANDGSFILGFGGFSERGVDVAVGYAAAAKIA